MSLEVIRTHNRGRERFRSQKASLIDVEEEVTSSASNSPDLKRTKSVKMQHNKVFSSDETESGTTQCSETDSLSDIDEASDLIYKLRKSLEEALENLYKLDSTR